MRSETQDTCFGYHPFFLFLCTFEIFKNVLVKVCIPPATCLAVKIIVSKSESTLCCESFLSVIEDVLIPSWVFRICLNIFYQTDQLMAVYLGEICVLKFRFSPSFFHFCNGVIQKIPGHVLSWRVTEVSTGGPSVLQRRAVIPLSWQQIMVHETCTLSYDAG